MNAEATTIMGTLKPDGVLELDEKLNLPAGRVRVTVEPLPASGETQDPFMARMEAIWAGQRARGFVPRSAEEVEAERRALREESEQELLECERIHREAEEARRRAGQQGEGRQLIAYLDANVVIYFVEGHPVWGPKAVSRIARLQAAGDAMGVSDLARLECLVGPLASGNAAVLADFDAFFRNPAVRVYPLSAAVCERGARIRAIHHFKPLDALHLAAAVEHGCGLFLTNDAALARFPDVAVEILT